MTSVHFTLEKQVLASILTRDATLAQYMLSSCVRPFVSPSVRHKSGVLQKWLNLGSRKERHTIAQGL